MAVLLVRERGLWNQLALSNPGVTRLQLRIVSRCVPGRLGRSAWRLLQGWRYSNVEDEDPTEYLERMAPERSSLPEMREDPQVHRFFEMSSTMYELSRVQPVDIVQRDRILRELDWSELTCRYLRWVARIFPDVRDEVELEIARRRTTKDVLAAMIALTYGL